jgi:hypothetical protein
VRLLLLAALLALPARAEESATFLKLGTGARAVALGGAYTALADGADALGWNVAGLAGMKQREVAAAHAELVENTRHDFAAYAHPTAQGTFAAGLIYLSHGSFEGRDATGRVTGKVTAADAAVSAGWARNFDGLQAGAAVKFVTSHIAEAEAHTAAVDLGLKRELTRYRDGRVLAGVALRNLGPGLKYASRRDHLPLQAAGGLAWAHEKGALAVEFLEAPYGAGGDAAFGGEYKLNSNFAFRAGYSTMGVGAGSGFDALKGLSFGLGLSKDALSVDYAVVPGGELGSAHRFGLSYRF